MAIADHLRQQISQPIHDSGLNLTVSASIGVTLVKPGELIDTVLERADHAMYAAKRAGRNQTICRLAKPQRHTATPAGITSTSK